MKTLPRNPEAELLVLGCCLLGGTRTASTAMSTVTSEDFSELAHVSAWRVLTHLVESGQPVDLVNFDMAWPRLVDAPPQPPLEILEAMDKVPSAENLPLYVATLKEYSRRRLVWQAGHQLVARASDPKADVEEGVASALSSLQANAPALVGSIETTEAVQIMTDDLDRRHQLEGRLSGVSTGFAYLDRLTEGLQPQELSIIGARPSQGKTALLVGMAAHAALRTSTPTLFITLEQCVAAIMRRMASQETSTPLCDLRRGKMSEQAFSRFTGFSARLRQAPLWFFEGAGGVTINRLAGIVRHHVAKHGTKLVVIDYLQKIRPSARHEKRTYEVAECSGVLKALAVQHHLHVCAAAQLNRDPDKDGTRPPRLSDLADSGQIERDADLVILMNRARTDADPHGSRGDLIVAKQRDGEIGSVPVYFNGQFCRFERGEP